MGLLDCVSDKSGKYPVSPGEAPLTRASDIPHRRSMGKKPLFASNTSIKNKDIDYWRNRLLQFLYKSEGREDVRELRMPMKQLGYKTIGDFIRDIPPEIYEPYKNHINPDTGLRKDYRVIWERDGIAEPGMFKGSFEIDGHRCMGLQLDRKKAVPFGTHDGKGLFYCKPGHRALVPVDEVYPYKEFLRQFIGLPPRKDSMPLNLLPGRSSVRVAVAKQYKPGDRVHLPTENKWATILWTGRIGGEWVVDLVYDPEKPATGKMASPDEPCMSRSLSMADFIDEVGKPSTASTPPSHVPPPPPKSPKSPKSPEPDDDVFLNDQEVPVVVNQDDGFRSKKDSDESDVSDAESYEDSEEEDTPPPEHSDENPLIESSSESETEEKTKRTFSEPTPNKQEVKKKGLEVFEQEPLRSRPTHKPLFNLASFGGLGRKQKNKTEKLEKQPPAEKVPSPSPKKDVASPKRDLLFFSKNKSKSPKSPNKEKQIGEPILIQKTLNESPKTILSSDQISGHEQLVSKSKEPVTPVKEPSHSFFRRDRSRSPVHRNDKKTRWSGHHHRESPIDVPEELQSPKTPDTPPVEVVSKSKQPKSTFELPAIASPLTKVASTPKEFSTPKVIEVIATYRQEESSEEETSFEEHEESAEESQEIPKQLQVVSVEVNQQAEEREPSECSSEAYSPPYSPAIKDVGIHLHPQSPKKDDQKVKSSPLKTLGAFFSPKKKTLPPKDYEHAERQSSTPEPPERKESLENQNDTDESDSLSSEDAIPPTVTIPAKEQYFEKPPQTKRKGGFFSRKSKKPSIEVISTSTPIETFQQQIETTEPIKVTTHIPKNDQGDQEGIFLDSLDVKHDEKAEWSGPPTQTVETSIPKRRDSKGKDSKGKTTFTFGFSKKSKQPQVEHEETPVQQLNQESQSPNLFTVRKDKHSESDTSLQEDSKDKKSLSESPPKDIPKNPESKPKKNSLKDSFARTFSFSKEKRRTSFDKFESVGDFRTKNDQPRPGSLYIDNNEAIGAKDIKKSKSTSALIVDIQPWNERRGRSTDIYEVYNSPTEDFPSDVGDSNNKPNVQPVPALLPKAADPSIPKHRIFTTPKSFFGFSQKPTENSPDKPKKKLSFKGSKLPKAVSTTPTTTEVKKVEDVSTPNFELPPLPKSDILKPPISPRKLPSTPPPQVPSTPPPKVPTSPSPKLLSILQSKLPSTPPPTLPSSPPPAKEKKKSSFSGSDARKLKSAMKQRKEIDSIPKGIKIGDRVIWYNGRIPIPGNVMKLYKDGTDKYTAVVNFDRAIAAEPLSLIREGDGYIVTVEELLTPELLGISLGSVSSQTSEIEPQSTPTAEVKQTEDAKIQTVRFEPSESTLPEITVEPSTTGSPKQIHDEDESVPPPFQEEEVDLACGLRRGIPSHDRSCCIEAILFAMFYTNNAFDVSVLYGSGFEKDELTRNIKNLLRQEIVQPLRQSGFCEYGAIKKLKDFMQTLSPDFNAMSTDAEVMLFILFERALKLGKFISYSTGVTDYLHQIALDPRDFSKSSTLQQMFETSLEHMENSKLRTVPTPALILEIPRANDKLVHYEAVIPNLSLMMSHLLESGPRLCICGMSGQYECRICHEKSGSIVFCDNCKSMADQIHFQLNHEPVLLQIAQPIITMDLIAVICNKGGHYTAFVKCGNQRSSPWLFYDGAEIDNPKVSLEQNLGMWIDRLEKYPGKYQEAFAHPLLTHFLANSHICIYQSREKSSLV